MLLRDLAAAWVRSNCPRPDLQANLLQHFDHAAQRGVTCSFVVGRELTRSGKSYLVCPSRNMSPPVGYVQTMLVEI